MEKHPGVYVPPPLIYVAFFFLSLLLQRHWPMAKDWQDGFTARVLACLLLVLCLLVLSTALFRFAASKNTLITVKPAHSLQTTGIYAHSRNPMYLGLVLLYAALAIFKGNTWTLVLLPVLVLTVQTYVIRKEESYLDAAFGTEYRAYRKKVRRWL